MGEKATTVEKQINLLKDRGMTITDIEKAKEVLLDIGYYRLGFYWFPYEITYPNKLKRNHCFKKNTDFDNIVKLYYFDFNLRNFLMKYINRIEINFRTYLTYHVSNKYVDSPTWFVDPSIVKQDYIQSFNINVYNENFKKNPIIKTHHTKHINDKYAPAWKTIEFMTLGAVINLFNAIKDEKTKTEICKHYGINKVVVFNSYINLVRKIRNQCAHGNVLYDLSLPTSIRKGPVGKMEPKDYHNLNGAIKIIRYMLGCVSKNRENDMKNEINSLLKKYAKYKAIHETLKKSTGINNYLN